MKMINFNNTNNSKLKTICHSNENFFLIYISKMYKNMHFSIQIVQIHF